MIEILQLEGFDFFIFGDVNAFLLTMILLGAILGGIAKSASVSGLGGFIVFIYIGQNYDGFIYAEMMYLILVILFLAMGFKIASFYMASGGKSNGV